MVECLLRGRIAYENSFTGILVEACRSEWAGDGRPKCKAEAHRNSNTNKEQSLSEHKTINELKYSRRSESEEEM